MKNSLIMMSTFLITCSSFAQKDELRDLERAFKRNNTSEVSVFLTKMEETLVNATDDQKAAYYFFKAQNEINLANSGDDLFANRSKAISTINQLIRFENETKSKKYTTEISSLKNNLLAQLVNEAIGSNKKKDYKNSSRLFEQAYRLNSTDTIYLFNAASDAANGKDYDFAESKYKELVNLNFDGTSKTYVATSQVTGKVQSFGTDVKARDLAVKNGTHTQPETEFNKSVKPEIYYNLGLILLNKQNYSEAEEFVLTAYDLDKNNINALMNVLMLYYNTNRMDKYEEYATKGLERFPKNEVLLYNLAVIHLGNKEIETAQKYFEKITQNNPHHFESLRELGNIELHKDAEVTNKINALPNTITSDKKREELMLEKKTVYENALKFYLKAQKVNDKDSGLNELIIQIQDFLDKQ
ncbi:MAG TPA: tetratricopeptide repeat protein [Flavobacterium sp.]|nr:tetratricopeptide repeat protein [Flavobacterium sp.]